MRSHDLNRRAFLKLSVHFLSVVGCMQIHRHTALANSPSRPSMTLYGAGAYGQRVYGGYNPGQTVYLPTVMKGGD